MKKYHHILIAFTICVLTASSALIFPSCTESSTETTQNKTSITEKKVMLTLQWDQIVFGAGRIKSTSGNYVFELRR